jgi:hypothetical protein
MRSPWLRLFRMCCRLVRARLPPSSSIRRRQVETHSATAGEDGPFAATPAVISAVFLTAQWACARFGSTRRDAAGARGATSAACNAIPVEKKPFLSRVPWRTRVQLRHARLRSALQLLPELGDVAGAS